MSQSLVERAAGGVVFRETQNGLQVLLIEDAYGHVTFPKGHLEVNESWEDAAVREIFEETGIQAHIVTSLGRVEYTITRDMSERRKQVRFFLLEAIDDTLEPTHQAEEIASAKYVHFEEAKQLLASKGYPNWDFALEKANLLWTWHKRHLEQEWRLLPASSSFEQLSSAYAAAEPVIQHLVRTVKAELRTVMPDVMDRLPVVTESSLPKDVEDVQASLLGAIEHTLLKAEASQVDVENLAHEAVRHQFRAVCVNPQHVRAVSRILDSTGVISCTVVGFPLGAVDTSAIAAETKAVIDAGATEVDMVIPIGSMKEDDVWSVYESVRAVCDAAKGYPQVAVKVIMEAHFLSYDQLAKACLVSLAAGAHFLKTSTGFAPSGAKIADVALMALLAGNQFGVKAAGGIRTRNDAVNYLRFGATRIGTSSGVSIVRE